VLKYDYKIALPEKMIIIFFIGKTKMQKPIILEFLSS